MEVPFKILSIDGGGIKGIYSATILKHLQDEFCGNNHISEYFDLICGTSTGGLIALALTTKTDLTQIVDFYEKKGTEIFPKYGFLTKIRQGIYKGKYSNKNLKKNLEEILENKTLNDANNLLCIPSFNIVTNKPKIWKFPHKEGNFSTDKNVKMIDVALATSAAPTFFPVHQISDFGKHIDGGIWANNPTLCGITEAIKYFLNKEIKANKELKFTSIEVLSIGSINTNIGENFSSKNNRSYLNWGLGKKLIDIMMSSSSFGANQISNDIIFGLNNNSKITRIETTEISKNHQSHIDMDLVNENSIKLLKELANERASYLKSKERNSVETFFLNKKHYKTN